MKKRKPRPWYEIQEEAAARREEMRALREHPYYWSYQRIGKKYGITRQRAYQILNRPD